ncbi:MAG: hypothetical protein WCP16_26355, partial [Pseudanabaena sp. ELA645]
MRLDLSKLIIQDQDLADSSRLDVTFFKNSGITRFWAWTSKDTKSAFNSIPDISIPKPWYNIYEIVTVIGAISNLISLFCLYLNERKQLNELGAIIALIAVIGSTGMLPVMILTTFISIMMIGIFLFGSSGFEGISKTNGKGRL